MSEQSSDLADCRAEIDRLRRQNNLLQIDLDLANCERRDAIDALEAFQGYDGDEELWAAMKRERDEAVAKLAEARRLLGDVVHRSGLRRFEIKAFLAETQPNGEKW